MKVHEVGFSTLWINSEITYQFLNDVIRELASLTPGPYIHIGGDEARSTPEEDYKKFIKRVQEIVVSHGKIAIGWSEIGEAELLPGTIAQIGSARLSRSKTTGSKDHPLACQQNLSRYEIRCVLTTRPGLGGLDQCERIHMIGNRAVTWMGSRKATSSASKHRYGQKQF